MIGRTVLVLLTGAWLTGCSTLPTLTGPNGEDVGALLAYGLELRTLAPRQRAALRRANARDLAANDTPTARIRLALALLADDSSREELDRADALLAPVADGRLEAPPGQVALARWLRDDVQRAAAQRAQARDLASLRVHAATLESQLQAIRSIEQQLEQRESNPKSEP